MTENPPHQIDPFRHFNPQLWIDSKKAHITLFSIGSLLVIPAVYSLFTMAMFLSRGFGFGVSDMDSRLLLGIISIGGTVSTGTLAWSALGFLFFKRADSRWQRISWNLCTLYGWIGTISYLGWFIFLIQEADINFDGSWGVVFFFAIFLFIILSAAACIIYGRRHASSAKKFLQSLDAEQPS
ncbi:hypothetical protein [Haloferula sp.]|uniref:hypothetical protein n=1 Tax=Haloferula sp. TaxID=2497595 RepID=UPI00329D9565